MRATLWVGLLWGTAFAAEPSPQAIAQFKPEATGFIDDAFAVRDDGQAIAYLTTDGAARARLHLAEIPAGKPEVVVEGLPTEVRALHWLSPDRVLVVTATAAQVYGPKGALAKEQAQGIDDAALATVDGKPAVVTYRRTEKKGSVGHTIAAYHAGTWKPLGKKTLVENSEGQVPHPSGTFKILWWRDGYTSAATLKAGEFDKARDMRRPDRFAHFDVLRGKVLDEKEVEDVLRFTQLSLDHKKAGNQAAFVHLADDRKQLLYTDGLTQDPITLARPLYMYQAEAFQFQILDAGKLAVSGAVDPMNPPALNRQKADPDDFDLHVIDRTSRSGTRVLRLDGQGRPASWRIGGKTLAMLRKNKGFDRGGVLLELYPLSM